MLRRTIVAMILVVTIALVVFLVIIVVLVLIFLISPRASQCLAASLFQFLFERIKQTLEIGGFVDVSSDKFLFLVTERSNKEMGGRVCWGL